MNRNNNSVVAIYPLHTAAEAAIKELQRSGFDMKKLSIIGRDYHTDEQVVGYYNIGDRMKAWGKTGAFWGGAMGISLWFRVLLDSRFGAGSGGGAVGQLDCRGTGRRDCGRWSECGWSRSVQSRHP